jgi:O-methyltransferase involved in polyketide biosynthesis
MHLLLLCSVGLLACDRTTTPATGTSGLSTEQFVDLYVELRKAKRESTADAEFQQKKREILARARTTEENFSRFVDDHGRDLTLMAAVWDSVQRRIDRGDSTEAR